MLVGTDEQHRAGRGARGRAAPSVRIDHGAPDLHDDGIHAPGVVGDARVGTALRALEQVFGGCPELNLWVRTAPMGAGEGGFHWHIDISPRSSIKAGFELGTGIDINTYPPEQAAADLREALGN